MFILLKNYIEERIQIAKWIVIASALCGLALWNTDPDFGASISSFMSCLTLVLALRISDDLYDFRNDKIQHPQRVLIKMVAAHPYSWIVLVLTAVLLFIISFGITSPSQQQPFLLLLIFISTLYLMHFTFRKIGLPPTDRDLLKQWKYPLLMIWCKPASGELLDLNFFLTLFILSIFAVGFEIHSDPRFHPIQVSSKLLKSLYWGCFSLPFLLLFKFLLEITYASRVHSSEFFP